MSKIILNETNVAPATPSTGKVAVTAKTGGIIRVTDDQGDSHEFGNHGSYGENFHYANAYFEDTNQTETFKTYTSFNYSSDLAIPGFKYEIVFSCLVRYSNGGRNFICRVAIDGNTLEEEIRIEPKDTGSDIRRPLNYNYIIDGADLISAGGVISLDYKSQENGDTARVHSATITFKRVI